ncbi:MAG: IS630 family transposase [Alphaproteobacteria bacterium]
MEAYPEDQRVYLDESGLCHRLQRTHGYAEKGQRVHGLTYGKRQGRTNIIGAWSTINKLFAMQTYDHTVNKAVFIAWIKDHLLKHLKKGMVVIMDNAPWHKGNDIKELIEGTGAKLIKLPPYSPDLNPIEHAWANLKHYVKSAKHAFDSFAANLTAQILKMNHSNSV